MENTENQTITTTATEETTTAVAETSKKVAITSQAGFLQTAHNFLSKNGASMLPPNYDVNSAVKSLYLKAVQTKTKTGEPVLKVCTPASIVSCIQTYIANGLNVDKNQCYLIPYGKALTLQISSYGKQKQAKAYANIKINSGVIYEGENFKIVVRPDGTKLLDYNPDPTKWDINKIAFAFAVAVKPDGTVDDTEIMTKQELRISASKSQSGGSVWKEFPVEMSRKTVSARLAKHYVSPSDDATKFEVQTDVNIDFDEKIDADAVVEDAPTTDDADTQATPTEVEGEFKMSVDNLENDGNTKEIYYSEFKNNKDKYRAVPDSYDKEKKTIKVYC